MAISNILNLSNRISLSRNTRERQSTSSAGFIRGEIGGATTFEIDCDYPIMNQADFLKLQKAFLEINDGISFLDTGIPAKAKLTIPQGNLTVNLGQDAAIVEANSSGATVQLANIQDITSVYAGDYIQFKSSDGVHKKVYQIKQDSSAENNIITITLTQGVVFDLNNDDEVLYGDNVIFKTKLISAPTYTSIPRNSNENLYKVDGITLIESL